jgi:hypothetical protein
MVKEVWCVHAKPLDHEIRELRARREGGTRGPRMGHGMR